MKTPPGAQTRRTRTAPAMNLNRHTAPCQTTHAPHFDRVRDEFQTTSASTPRPNAQTSYVRISVRFVCGQLTYSSSSVDSVPSRPSASTPSRTLSTARAAQADVRASRTLGRRAAELPQMGRHTRHLRVSLHAYRVLQRRTSHCALHAPRARVLCRCVPSAQERELRSPCRIFRRPRPRRAPFPASRTDDACPASANRTMGSATQGAHTPCVAR